MGVINWITKVDDEFMPHYGQVYVSERTGQYYVRHPLGGWPIKIEKGKTAWKLQRRRKHGCK